ncbi:DUF6159 family protein [Dinghuibacter silviterrae]|uniref:Glycerophosphoryl diester phosphodiesterase family protein n=1 Tax=Dinghuibacter silviterrae TaxID=1539049 RepID=A0A4R8DPP5_9BACT|nr:DUF6159 family protein [Dinghuibacter silviterrae]TDW99266.1 hypothetical protein EDB95_0275 [Dinghuibacter silviterrae]
MSLSSRLSNGWTIAMSSLDLLKKNKQLIVLPILSGVSMTLILGSFVLVLFLSGGTDLLEQSFDRYGQAPAIACLFLFYLVNYFIVIFFNMALIHCTKRYLEGGEVSIQEGIQFSVSRLGAIFSWAAVAATVGTVLKVLQDNLGSIGKIVVGLLGMAWSILTFFVVPVIAYENVGPFQAIARSKEIVHQKWGEGLGAGFSFGLVYLLGIVCILAIFAIGFFIHPVVGVILAVLAFLLFSAIISAARTIFVSAIYHNVTGDIQSHIDQQLVDSLFVSKR